MKNALISVSDKRGILEFAQGLEKLGFRIISTGGTFHELQNGGIKNLIEVSDFTGLAEGLDGRIKTLTPKVFGGILCLREEESHQEYCKKNNIDTIDLVVVNLYPFKKTYDDPAASLEEKIEKIDIGGPSMVRAAAKNYEFCAPVVDRHDYPKILEALATKEGLSSDFRKVLAAKVFEMTAHYDLLIAKFWVENSQQNTLRYGENPHQSAVILLDPFSQGTNLVNAEILNGKPLSFNNLADATSALELVISFEKPFATIVKHMSPCGAAEGKTIEDAFEKAYKADPVSAFGGVIAVNQPVTKGLAEQIVGFFNEIVIAPDFSPEALKILKQKKNLRVLRVPHFHEKTNDIALRRVRGGTLIESLDTKIIVAENLKRASKKSATPEQLEDMLVAWEIVKMVKSNAIVIVKDGVMIGKGGGQTSRVEAMNIACQQAGEKARGAVLASDAFFPFPDSVELAGKAGISAIIQPGGSLRDEEVFKKADEVGIAMVLTGTRAFLH